MTTERERTGVVGLGVIGGGITRSLLRAGFPCAVYDINEERTRALQEAGARACADAATVARQADLLILAPFNVTQVESILSQDGALQALAPGASLAVVSTIPPAEAKRLADLAAAQGHVLLDCPVSGGAQAAAEGRLTAMMAAQPPRLSATAPSGRPSSAESSTSESRRAQGRR